MESFVKSVTIGVALFVEAGAVLVVAIAVLQTIWRIGHLVFKKEGQEEEGGKTNIRLSLGRWLAMALEFELAADILRTAVAPTWQEIGKLGAIIVLRTALNFFLQHEIERESGQVPGSAG